MQWHPPHSAFRWPPQMLTAYAYNMTKRNVLVSGASGVIGYGILKSLRKSGKDLHLIGTTVFPDSVAQGFCDTYLQPPMTSDARYMSWLLETIRKHEVELLIPGIEPDLFKWCEHRDAIERAGARIVMNTEELIHLCQDKWHFYQRLLEVDFPYAIESSLSADFHFLAQAFGLPFLLKPRRGNGSRGIVRVDGIERFREHQSAVGPVLMAQPIVGCDEEEYTTSAFCDGEGGFFTSLSLKRRLAREGYTEKAEVVEDEAIIEAVSMLCRLFKPVGPTNFQFRREGDAMRLLEINPRISSSTSIRAGFGYNEASLAVEFYLENRKMTKPTIRPGKAVRYIEDFFYYEDRSGL
jgi:carbamoyl-phosphate synthase large subunit